MHRDERVAVEDADQVGVGPHAESLAEQRERHRVERPADFDVAIGMDRPLSGSKKQARTTAALRLSRTTAGTAPSVQIAPCNPATSPLDP